MKSFNLKKPALNKYVILDLIITVGLFVLSLFVLLDTPLSLQKIEAQIVPPTFAQLPIGPTQSVAGVHTVAIPVTKITDLHLPQPQFTAQAVLAQDLGTNQMLYQKNIHARLAPASTTKLMTVLVAMDYYKTIDVLTVYPSSLVDGSTMSLRLGEKITFLNLLYGLLLNSGNDAAFTLANNYPGGIPAFVTAMNAKAASLGLKDTHFTNPAGFDDPEHYSSAYDLSVIAKEAIKYQLISKIVATKNATVTSAPSTESTSSARIVHNLENVNQLLGEPGVIGIKTGYTEKAGENLVGLVDRQNHAIITVVLDSTDRFGETKTLIDWLYQDYTWTTE